MGGYVSLVEPLVVLHTVSTSFFGMALTLVVYSRSLELCGGQSDVAQALSMRFFLFQGIVTTFCALLSIAPLTRLAECRGGRVRLLCPQLGSVLSMGFLLALLLLRLPLEVLYVGAALHGLSGGSPGFWSGVVALASLQSNRGRRTLKLNTVDFCAGAAGVVSGLLSGHVYSLGQSGVALVGTAMFLGTTSILYSTFLLSFPEHPPPSREDLLPLLHRQSTGVQSPRVAVALVMAALVLFDVGMSGAEDVLSLYVLKPPLSWDSVWAGYGSAATQAMYLSSFLGVLVLSPRLGDTTLILLGIVSNCTGMAIMAFATHSWVYFMARGIMLFACVPMPTLKAQLSKILDAQQYGSVFGWLQLALSVGNVVSTAIFTLIYPLTLPWHSGFCFLISSAISYCSIIPVLYLNCKSIRSPYVLISGDE